MRSTIWKTLLLLTCLLSPAAYGEEDAVTRLTGALLGPTPMVDDLRQLSDEIGGRPTGSAANLKAVDWALEKFREAGVEARKEAFQMPAQWLENSASAVVSGDGVRFVPRVAAMPFSTSTEGLTAPLVDGGQGSEDDFTRLGDTARGAFVLIETEELEDLAGLFAEYSSGSLLEPRAFAAEVAGVVYMGSRPRDLLYRHNASLGVANRHPMLVMERDAALRAMRLLGEGHQLTLEVDLDLKTGGPYESYNVIGEIRGREKPEEVVLLGAHLDSWGLGTGALDNGCNVAMVIDIARQMKRLGLVPRRTIRFALWNGEEQGFFGSWDYVKTRRDAKNRLSLKDLEHLEDLEHHVMASSFDIGSGRINGFFTGGRPEVLEVVERVLEPVRGLGPFTNLDLPIVGTDNYDFMMEGIANLVASQESANYGPNYHARSDTFDKVDLQQLRLNATIAAAVIWGFAEAGFDLPHQSRAEIQELIDNSDLEDQMNSFAGLWDAWVEGKRGRSE